MDRPAASPGPAPTRPGDPLVTAILGPTNTGKTHFAMERLLAHESGMIGFPLRLLARENYERAVRAKGADAVALVTGEEKILPPRARYFCCTVEAMPLDRGADFVAIDEVQLAADPERGHIFTDRLLRARGRKETILIGAETIRALLRRIVPEAEPISRQRLSRLTYAGPKKITRMPPRSAVIGFSATEVYALAELMRRRRGGTAVVLGALSPRTRNAQVGLYQSGDVDYLVATDAIGMGLNLDIDHVAFSRLSKFDGRSPRRLTHAELGQIAGRAGRHMNDGTFGTTAGEMLPPEAIEAVEQHRFENVKFAYWRNPQLDCASVPALLGSLTMPPGHGPFMPARHAEDVETLLALSRDETVRRLADSRSRVALLWETCQIPDFRKVLAEAHARLVGRIFVDLAKSGAIGTDWLARQVERIDKSDGDIGTLVGRIAEIRTWTYVSYRPGWIADALHWQERTRHIEDKLSDVLHERLTERFVDRRTSVLMRRLGAKDELLGGVKDDGEVVVEGVTAGRIEGFRFHPNAVPGSEDARAVRNAADRALRQAFGERVRRCEIAADGDFALGADGRVVWQGVPVAALAGNGHILAPAIRPLVEAGFDAELRERLRARLAGWLTRHIAGRLGPLAQPIPPALKGSARGLFFQLQEALGCVPRLQVAGLLQGLGGEDRKALARLGVRLGVESVFMPRAFGKPQQELAALLWALARQRAPETLPRLSKAGGGWLKADPAWPEEFYRALGFRLFDAAALRADRLEALAAAARRLASQGEFALTPALAQAGGCPPEIVTAVLRALGYRWKDDAAGGAFSTQPRLQRARTRPPRSAANPDSPFAHLKELAATK